MDQPSNQPTPPQTQQPGRRDMMFCHECADEWYRDERGLTCPECGSDFTEIIEDNNDPRDTMVLPDDDDAMPDLETNSSFHAVQHNPWADDDPDEEDISNVRFTSSPGRLNFHATITRSVSPQQLEAGMGPASIAGFMQMLNGLVVPPGSPQPPGQQRGQGEGLFSGPGSSEGQSQSQNQSAFNESRSQSQGGGTGPQVRTSRFTYHGGARLYPRDPSNPEPRIEPVDDLANVVTGLMAALGAPPGSINTQAHLQGGAEAHFHGGHANASMQNHPLGALLHSLGIVPTGGPGANMGDFVFSQEGLDRIVSQLMEQTATSSAPGPAPAEAIAALPRKEVSEDMLGSEHKAECSICMDEVMLGEEVTVLPCKHWFHHQCVAAWLSEHDTCPHCRQGIEKKPASGDQAGASSTSNTQSGAATEQSTAGGSRQMPGAFGISGSGATQNSFVVPGDAGSAPQGSSNNANTQSGASSDPNNSSAGGISDRIQRGLFGSPR